MKINVLEWFFGKKKKATTKKKRVTTKKTTTTKGIFSTVKFESSPRYGARIHKFYMNGKVMSDRSSWISISKNQIYISRSGKQGRQYWVLSKSRPSIRFDNEKMTLTIANNYKVKFRSLRTLNKVKSILQ